MSVDTGDRGERRDPGTESANEGTGETGEERTTQREPTKPSTLASGEGKSERGVAQAQREKPGIPMSGDEDVVWVRVAPSQVVRTVAVALSTAAALLRGSFCSGRYELSSTGSSSPSFWRPPSTRPGFLDWQHRLPVCERGVIEMA